VRLKVKLMMSPARRTCGANRVSIAPKLTQNGPGFDQPSTDEVVANAVTARGAGWASADERGAEEADIGEAGNGHSFLPL
jgi:hypothetical protein